MIKEANLYYHPIEHFCCQLEGCSDRGIRGRGNLVFRGWSGQSKTIRMVYCRTCRGSFSERRGTAFEGLKLPTAKLVEVLRALSESNGTRATSRLTGVHRDTVTGIARIAGTHAKRLHAELVGASPCDEGSPARREVVVRR